MSDVSVLVRRDVENAELRVRSLSVTRNSETNWPTVTWLTQCFDSGCFNNDCFFCSPQIRAHFRPISSNTREVAAGVVVDQRYEITTWAPIKHLDRIIWQGITFEIENEPHIERYKGYYMYRRATIVRVS